MNINGGTLEVTGDYEITSLGRLFMEKEEDKVKVGGNFLISNHKNWGYHNILSAGVMEIQGDFIQKIYTDEYGTGYADNFNASGTHTVILNGSDVQTISFVSTSSYFNNLKLVKDKKTGYIFSTDNCWNTLYLNTNVKQVVVQSVKDSLQQGGSLIFTAVVEGILNPDQSVIWSLKGNTSKDTTLSENGLLTVGEKEQAEVLEIIATSVQDTTKVGIVKVTVEEASETLDSVEMIYTTLGTDTGAVETMWSAEHSLIGDYDKEEIKSSLSKNVGQSEVVAVTNSLVDSNQNEYYYEATIWSLENGVIAEIDSTSFVPEDFRVDKEEVTILYRTVE
mgnify:CR=1 FL=1